MSLSTYSELLEDVTDTLDRDDIETRFPRWVRLVESRLNRLLEDPDMEVVSNLVAAGVATALPADFGSMVAISDGEGRPLLPMGPVEFAGVDRTISGTPIYYTIEDNAISFAPANATANIRLVYRRTIPALTEDNATNWLLDRAPDVYFYGILLQANAWDVSTEQAAGWKGLFDEAIDELRTDGSRRKWGAGPLAPRIRRT